MGERGMGESETVDTVLVKLITIWGHHPAPSPVEYSNNILAPIDGGD